jgi:prepilin-type N-terminal cleavage/methylation domain-containing protein
MKQRNAFTLIELLVVISIILILIAIALPNFLNAQLRSKVARCKGDFHGVSTALFAYQGDYRKFPPSFPIGLALGAEMMNLALNILTTPTKYMSSVEHLIDPFSAGGTIRSVRESRPIYMYFSYDKPVYGDAGHPTKGQEWIWRAIYVHNNPPEVAHPGFMLFSSGPDIKDDNLYWAEVAPIGTEQVYRNLVYSPTNGLRSWGDIGRLGGMVRMKSLKTD